MVKDGDICGRVIPASGSRAPAPPVVRSLSPRRGIRGHRDRHPVSRDYDMRSVKCRVSECPANQRDMCSMPSCISIRADGKCELGQKARDKAEETHND